MRERVPVLRLRAVDVRGDLRAGFAAALAAFVVERVPAVLRAVEARAALPVEDFARVDVAFFAPLLERASFDAVERLAVDRLAADDLRAGFAAALPPDEVEAEPSIDHLPLITRCAASATASAINDPSLVALETTLFAACDAESAASSPASRIFLRAAGLAAIAAAAAVNPAASISLLIAALASFSTVLSLEPERDDDELERLPEEVEREELLRADFAISSLPASRKRHFNAVPVPK